MQFGLPRVITPDQGREFHNELNAELAKRVRIDHRLSTPYHPQVSPMFLKIYDYNELCACFTLRNLWEHKVHVHVYTCR